MELTWLDPDHLRERDVAGAVALLEAARQVDSPWRTGETPTSLSARLRHGSDGDPPVAALARDGRGRPVGFVGVSLPRWDNTHMGVVVPTVDPHVRRGGLGRRLFDAGLDRLRADGRTLVFSFGFDSPAVHRFAEAVGMAPTLEVTHRRLDLRTLEPDLVERQHAAAALHASGYELVRAPGQVPEEMMPQVVAMSAVINDAPTDDSKIEDLQFTAHRVRAYEQAQLAGRRRLYRLMARCRQTGDLAGHTVVAVDEQRPWSAGQHDTSVVRAHRGHRLGLLLKTGMLRWLAEEEPQLHTLDTSNAASNAHMIRVNDELGYQVVQTSTNWERTA